MRIQKYLLIGSILVFISAVLLLTVGVHAKSSSQDLDEVVLGEFCFNFVGYTDILHLRVDSLGNGYYSIVGKIPIYSGCPLSGSGIISGGHFYATLVGSVPASDQYIRYGIDIDLSTMTGTGDVLFYNWDLSVVIPYQSWPCERVSCSTPAPIEGPSMRRH